MAAARGRSKKSSTSGGGFLLWAKRVLGASALIAVGVIAGYVWRSYAPLALPFESALVSDASSDDVESASLKELVATADKRASKAEAERDRLRKRLTDLEKAQADRDREIADLQIKSVLEGPQN